MTNLYRPSNGTEGEIFMSQYCNRCIHDDIENNKGCTIIAFSMAYFVSDPEYPKQWIYGDDGKPTCTKFSPQ